MDHASRSSLNATTHVRLVLGKPEGSSRLQWLLTCVRFRSWGWMSVEKKTFPYGFMRYQTSLFRSAKKEESCAADHRFQQLLLPVCQCVHHGMNTKSLGRPPFSHGDLLGRMIIAIDLPLQNLLPWKPFAEPQSSDDAEFHLFSSAMRRTRRYRARERQYMIPDKNF